MNTDYKVEDYLDIHKKRHEVEKLSPDVLEDAMIVKSDLQAFNDDVNIIHGKKEDDEEISEYDLNR